MLESLSDATLVGLVGLAGGIALGLAARLGHFCTLGAIEDAYYGDSPLRAHMWYPALGVAIFGTFALIHYGLFIPTDSFYLGHAWNPAASIIGGLVFGYGMALSGNCGYGALARLGGGDLRSFVIVLVMGLSAYMMASGPLASLRESIFPTQTAQTTAGIAHMISRGTGITLGPIGMAIGALFLVATVLSKPLRKKPQRIFWGAVAGLAIVGAWYGTSQLAHSSFGSTEVDSHTFSKPLGETMLFLMTSSGGGFSFGVGSVLGVLIGAFTGSMWKGVFRWEACEDPRELRRQIIGAAIMGMGAVVAVGCSIGQGLSAFSLLAISGPVTLIAIVAGSVLGLRHLIAGFSHGV